MSKFCSNFPIIRRKACEWSMYVYAAIGFVAIFANFTDVFPSCFAWWHKLLIGIVAFALVYLICLLITTLVFYVNKRVCILNLNGNHNVYVQYGDIFKSDEIVGTETKRHIVINANRCFDVIVNDELVSSNSLHGRSMIDLYNQHRYTETSLSNAIIQKLINQPFDEINRKDKLQGHLKRYQPGTVVSVDVNESMDYYYLGMTTFDTELKAHTTLEEYMLSIQRLLEYCDTHASGFPVLMTLMGGKLARTGKDEKELLDYLIQLIKLNKERITYDLYLIIYDKSKDMLPIAGL